MANDNLAVGSQPFHHGLAADVAALLPPRDTVVDRDLDYAFAAHFHPYVHQLVSALVEKSVSGLQAADTDYLRTAGGAIVKLPDGTPRPKLYEQLFTSAQYAPTGRVLKPYPVKDIDFGSGGAYAVYNWELFYHVPLAISITLSRNGRFEEAQKWLHYIFDPTDNSSDPSPDRYWKVRQFHRIEVQRIEEILVNLSTQADPALLAETLNSIHAWKDAPFRPHLIARYRQSAYMVKAVTAYLDNLIAWGDSLFAQDTGESVSEATQLYVLAANILGPRPQEVPRKGWQRVQSYDSLRHELDELGNALTEVELDIPFDLLPPPTAPSDQAALATIASIGTALYFCVPRNDALLKYWDTVADRLFKIRNSLNLQGVFRQLPLFEPPIDPALLAKATAAGLDIGAVVSGLNQPMPLVRFSVLAAKATELSNEVKQLGALLLSAIEKEDAEALGVLRAQHERAMLTLGELVRYESWQEAIKAREAVEKTFHAAVGRYTYYERLLGVDDPQIAELDAIDPESLHKRTFSAAEPELTPRPITVTKLPAVVAGMTGGFQLSGYEAAEILFLATAQVKKEKAAFVDKIGTFTGLIPNFSAQFEPFGTGGSISFGGANLAAVAALESSQHRNDADRLTYDAATAARMGAYERREQEWAFQSNAVLGDIAQIYKQWRAAQLREAIAEQEWNNQQEQVRQAEQIEQFLAGEKVNGLRKTSTTALYTWLRREVQALYRQSFQLAYDIARKAERALQHELGDPGRTFLGFGYQAGKEGLLAGERLHLDVKRMEAAYLDLNRREYELTKHVSLRQLDPVALLRLRAEGTCEITLPEELFDLDCPGHYFRRLTSVAVSTPAVAGPYTTIACTLTLLRSTVRTSSLLRDGAYARDGEDTERFSDYFGRVESIVTSTGINDAGMFETNLREDRYLPFEGAGAVSRWTLDLPARTRQFDYDTITDVVLHLRYTAREGGVALRDAAAGNLAQHIQDANAVGAVRLLSLRHDFPTEWARFSSAEAGPVTAYTLRLRPEHYPYWARPSDMELRSVELYAKSANPVTVYADADGTAALAALSPDGSLLYGKFPDDQLPAAIGDVTWYWDTNQLHDAWAVVTWGSGA